MACAAGIDKGRQKYDGPDGIHHEQTPFSFQYMAAAAETCEGMGKKGLEEAQKMVEVISSFGL